MEIANLKGQNTSFHTDLVKSKTTPDRGLQLAIFTNGERHQIGTLLTFVGRDTQNLVLHREKRSHLQVFKKLHFTLNLVIVRNIKSVA